MFLSRVPSLIISICLSAIQFCLQFVSVFPLFLPFSYDAPALPSCYSHASVIANTNFTCTLSFNVPLCVLFCLSPFHLCVAEDAVLQFEGLFFQLYHYFSSLLLRQTYRTEVTKTFSLRNGQNCYSGLILLDPSITLISGIKHIRPF